MCSNSSQSLSLNDVLTQGFVGAEDSPEEELLTAGAAGALEVSGDGGLGVRVHVCTLSRFIQIWSPRVQT